MTLAPSEKHLEDWIVANPQGFGNAVDFGNYIYEARYIDRILARQMPLAYGRPDLIVTKNSWLYIVEIKKGEIDTHTLAQCLRYMYDLRAVWDGIAGGLSARGYETMKGCMNFVRGMIVGNSLRDKNILIACSASAIDVVLYDFGGQDYTFHPAENYFSTNEIFDQIRYGVIGQFMETVMMEGVVKE